MLKVRINNISSFLHQKINALTFLLYRKLYIPFRAHQIRKKEKINVVFLLYSLGAWKTETLYLAMQKHPRFNPILIISKFRIDDRENLRSYLTKKHYVFHEISSVTKGLWNEFRPDIIFYQKHYTDSLISLLNNLRSLACYTGYGFHSTTDENSFKSDFIYNAWQVYYENKTLCDYYSSRIERNIHNSYATGIPLMDELMTPRDSLKDQWKDDHIKKRIIYAPHHSIDPENWWQSSTFLETGDIILQLAEKYSDKIQWAFKPHPVLRSKLEKIWGKERTKNYYDKWSNMDWSQYEDGAYLSLFKHSDAMIHDCGSFIAEYHATGNPVMYLLREEKPSNSWNSVVTEAFGLHYFGRTKQEIETFIQNVINNIDSKKNDRIRFFAKNLTPPNNNSACENIINCILYKNFADKFISK